MKFVTFSALASAIAAQSFEVCKTSDDCRPFPGEICVKFEVTVPEDSGWDAQLVASIYEEGVCADYGYCIEAQR